MPGIFGAAAFRSGTAMELPFERVIERLRHQPRLGATRIAAPDGRAALAVVDLGVVAGSGTTARLADGRMAVVHGEITAPAAGAGIAAAVLADYRRSPASLTRLEDSYALAIWDAPARTLVLANDRFGLRNVYYCVQDGLVCFAPLVGALLAFGLPERRLHLPAVADFLAFEHVLGDATLLRGVRALTPGTVARFEAGRVTLASSATAATASSTGSGGGPTTPTTRTSSRPGCSSASTCSAPRRSRAGSSPRRCSAR